MREVKADSSLWIHREIGLAGFNWQEGYGAFTISAGHIEKVREYVLHQEEHHRGTTFQVSGRVCPIVAEGTADKVWTSRDR